uniref:Dmx-like 2 n=1 Tax=Callorhinchus milii TaxID=7868 RepID=A0A4W3KHV9_CALMI
MHLHQVLTGAVNPGDNCYSVGGVCDIPFTAYASGCDIVILGSDFECVQIIPGAKHGNIQVGCVECSLQLGSTHCIHFSISFPFTGNQLLTATDRLQLWSLPSNDIIEEEGCSPEEYKLHPDLNDWKCIWQFWYLTSGWKSAVVGSEILDKKHTSATEHFSFVYLAHPRAVTGFSWRKTSKYMPRGSVCNVLLTSCQDGICRLWAETLLPEDNIVGGQMTESTISSSTHLSHSGSQKDKIQHALETIHHLKHLRSRRRRSSVLASHTEILPSQLGTHDVHRQISHHANALCHFHIASSINPNTDIPPALAGTAFNIEEGGGSFVVHWLNNKELHFTSSMETFMQHLKKLTDNQIDEEKSSEHENEEMECDESTKASTPLSAGMPMPTLLLDRKIETLHNEWNRNADMLFTIHPVDGSFLVWHVKYLDEYHPGIFRQVQITFSSRIPVAFPTGDANSLSKNIMMYACTTSIKEVCTGGHFTKFKSFPDSDSNVKPASHHIGSLKINLFIPSVMMISKHIDGSLNQWAVTFAEESAFTTVLTVSHNFRYCGHRFHLNDLACHSVLPLLLTSSHHNALITPEADSIEKENRVIEPVRSLKGPVTQRVKNAATRTFHDPNAIYSELILWRMDPIGPLSYSGGVSELARINSLHTSAFSNVAWLPTLIPSYCLGTYCNSASACFVASDGQNLRLYQAVIDARKLLDELSDPEISKLVGEVFNIVSQQSTARPGCIIELDVITAQCGSNTQLLHVFQEDFILGYKPQKEEMNKEQEFSVPSAQGYRAPSFSEKFFLVVIDRDKRQSVLHMWHLHLKSLSVPEENNLGTTLKTTSGLTPLPRSASVANLQTASKLILSSKLVYSQQLNLPEGVEVIRATPSAGHLSSSSIYPVCLAPYLIVTSCSDGKVRFWRCKVDTNLEGDHLKESHTYRWEAWPLMNEEGEHSNSAVNVTGRPVAVSCSYTGRLAVAYKQPVQLNGVTSEEFSMHVSIFECESTGGSEWVLEQTIHLDELGKVGGVLDSRVSVDSNLFVYNKSDIYLNQGNHMTSNIKHLVHLDWVSKEDGSHVLTVGVGSKILMYGRLSGILTEQASSKDGMAVITLPLGGSIKQGTKSKWVLLRCVDLVSSVDGTPSLPVSLSWVRDGILVIGMDCEMHVYAQWKHSSRPLNDSECDSVLSLDMGSSVFETKIFPKKYSVVDGTAAADDVFGVPGMIQDGGLFEAAHVLSPTLPQYHPTQLLELMDLGKVRRAKAILSHLVKCIAGEVAIVRDIDPAQGGGPKRHLSRTISVSGSTAKDTIIAGREGTRDYTEIDSIPPLPLYALLSADQDTSYKTAEEKAKVRKRSRSQSKREPEDHYADLFQTQSVTTDDFIVFEIERKETKSKVINLSQYGPTYFGPEHARLLSSHLMHSSLPGLTRLEQMFLVALADTVATTSTEVNENQDKNYSGAETLDECGLRYLLAMRLHTCLLTSLPPVYRVQLLHQGLSTCHFAWAFYSEAEEELLNMIPAMQKGDPQWTELKAMGVGWWVRNINTLRKSIEKVAKAAFQRNNEPLDAALFYLAIKKKAVLWGLFRSQNDKKMTEFFSHNFTEDRWRRAALKNAFALLGKQRFEQSAAFFLLAGSLKDAIEVCLEKMDDIQLAMVIARLYESDYETSFTCKSVLYEKVLGCKPDGSEFVPSRLHPDPFLRSIAYWILKDYSRALDTLLEQPTKDSEDHPGIIIKSCNPAVFSFYNYLRTHPLLMRRHFVSPEGSLAPLGLAAEKGEDEINLMERKLFFTTANAHFKVGCPVLALEVLSKIPKVMKMFETDTLDLTSQAPNGAVSVNEAKHEEKAVDIGWPQTASGTSALDWTTSSSDTLDWGQSVIKVAEEPLKLDWEEDKDESEEDDGLIMKDSEIEEKAEGKKKPETPGVSQTLQKEDSSSSASFQVDVIAEQLKFRACLKILMTELRTLATGYEVDGGKLRFQLYNWLEKEISAMHQICNYKTNASYERHQIDRRRLQAKQEHAERRKWWLHKNQALLRVFMSYCSLHGAQGGGLASVRMELIFLLQESQQVKFYPNTSPLPLPTTLPLLSASIAPTKTVIANPVMHLSNYIHDILHTVVQMSCPPIPDHRDEKVSTLHTLAASLSACIYQSLCDSHSYSQTDTNRFTGMVYQGLLLGERRRLRTESIDEHVTPNSVPALWPGVTSLINLLATARDEDQPKLNVMLCEAVVAVYLSLLIHGIATHASNELFRLAAHPLNNRTWAAVFGGGVKIIIKPKKLPEVTPGIVCASVFPPEDVDRYRRRFNMKMLVPGRPVKETSAPPPVPTERPSYKEKFIPPELSMWDYFVAKPFLPPSDSGAMYDSDDSIPSDDDEDDDDAFVSDIQLQEHSDPNSYSQQAAIVVTNLPVTSPLGNAVLKTLENWQHLLQAKIEQLEGPPPNYINTYPSDLAASGGPAILRHKAMLEPDNTPFKLSSTLPVKRLWYFLVKQEILQDTFIRFIFTKKRRQSESLEDHVDQVKPNYVAEHHGNHKVEADLGYPSGKAKIIHKDSDAIMAFAINKANTNEMVLASTHDVQELDVSALLAAQSYTWIGEDSDRESRRNLNNVKRMTSHPVHQYYLTGAQDGSVRMFEWNRPQQVICFRQAGNARVTRLHFNSQGNKLGVADGEGFLSLWQVNQTGSNPKPYLNWQCHSKATGDFAFITCSSLVATAGQSNDNRNVCLWDTLISPHNSLVHGFVCHDNGATVLQYAPKLQLLVSGGRKGFICIFDVRQRQLLHTFQAHDSAIKALALDSAEDYFLTGSAEGNMKVWRLTGHGLIHSFTNEHAKQSIFRNIGAGVTQLEIQPANRIFSCGADGTVKTRVLPDHFNIPAGIFDIL